MGFMGTGSGGSSSSSTSTVIRRVRAGLQPYQRRDAYMLGQVGTLNLDMSFSSPDSAQTLAFKPTPWLGDYHSMAIFAQLTGATGGATDIYLQGSFNDGDDWFDYARWTMSSGAAEAYKLWTVSKNGQHTTLTTVGINESPALASNTIRGGDWGDWLRIVVVAGASTSLGREQKILLALSA